MKRMKHNGLILFIILCLFLAVPVIGFAEDEEPAKIADVAFKDVLRGMLNKGVYDDVYPSELAEFTGHLDFSDMGISDLRGLEYFVNVTSFDFSNNEIETLPTKIHEMENLEELNLSFNDLYQLPSDIADAPNLRVLNVSGNKLTNIPVRIQEMANLESLDISANRFEQLPRRLVYLHLTDFNCNYNFLTFEEGSDNLKYLNQMDVSGEKQYEDQLTRLSAITYVTDNGDFKVKWNSIDDIVFGDGTKATVSGYSILMDGEFIKTVDASETEYSFGWMENGNYALSVSPDYIIDEIGDFPIRSYTDISAVYGSDGPYLPDEEETAETSASESDNMASEDNSAKSLESEERNEVITQEGISVLTIILIGAVALLAAGLATMIIIFLKKDKA